MWRQKREFVVDFGGPLFPDDINMEALQTAQIYA